MKRAEKLQKQKPEDNDFVPAKVRHHHLLKVYNRFAKKMKKVFVQKKQN